MVVEDMQNNILRNSKLSKQGYRQKKLFKIFHIYVNVGQNLDKKSFTIKLPESVQVF